MACNGLWFGIILHILFNFQSIMAENAGNVANNTGGESSTMGNITRVLIEDYEEFNNFTERHKSDGPPVVMYFSGKKLPNGKSWCPDCVDGVLNPKVKQVSLHNYQEFSNFADKLPENATNVYLFFSGSKNENGTSWCVWCNVAEPVVEAYLKDMKREIVFAHVDVGDRDYWRNPQCPFRMDKRIKLMVIPTLLKWKGVQRLEGSQCTKRELLDMLFDEE